MKIQNKNSVIETENGIIRNLYLNGDTTNLADKNGNFGTPCFTFKTDDIKSMPHEAFEPYSSRTGEYTAVYAEENTIFCTDAENGISTKYILEADSLRILSETENGNISEFGINLNLNFIGKKDCDFKNQLLPTSPYTSADGEYMYFIFTRPNGRYVAAIAKTPCDGWKIKYSPFCCGHFILNLQFLASFDRVYGGSERKNIEIVLKCADTLKKAFEIISGEYGMPVVTNVLNGGFDGCAEVKIFGCADSLEIKSPDGEISNIDVCSKIKLDKFGFYTVTPIFKGKPGLNTVVWNGGNFNELFDKSCELIKKPYHPDDNLCEGGCFLWEMLINMRLRKNFKFDSVAKEELDIIMAKNKSFVPRRTIVPYALGEYAPYHIHESNRIQEQFFGVSILIEAYRVYNDKEILDFAVCTLKELVDNYMKNGMIFNGSDYTTVCCPMIPLVDAALLLKKLGDSRAEIFEKAAAESAEFLFNRGYSFPTEGGISDLTDEEREDGSISCTALALLYYCAHMKFVKKYAELARDIIIFHRAWTMYTPDARINGSSFRWWETIWEGDGEGPAMCAGHAWTIWQSEALYYCGLLFHDDKMLLESWNGYITNFSKTQSDGTMYSCYETDYIRGGGDEWTKGTLKQLKGENTDIKYTVAHGYPKHKDNSLSRYAWVRAAESWLKTAAILDIDGQTVYINTNSKHEAAENIRQIYINGEMKIIGNGD